MKMKYFIIIALISILIVNIICCSNIPSVKLVENTENEIFEPEDKNVKVENINGDIDVGEIKIINGESFKVEAKNVEKDKCKISIDNGNLNINYHRKNKGLNNNGKEQFIITIPEKSIFENIDLDIGCGDVKNQVPLNAKNIFLDTGVGEIKLNNIKSEMLTINTGTGDIEISGDIINSINADTGVGEVVLSLDKPLNEYNVDLQTAIGEIKVGTEEYMSSYSKNNDSIKNNIKAATGVGDIKIK